MTLGGIGRRAAYSWHNGTDPVTTSLHHCVDAARQVRPSGVVSRTENGALTIAYAGLADGLTHVLPFLEQRRVPLAGPAATRDRISTSWWAIGAGTAAEGADLVAVGASARRTSRQPAAHSLVLPFRVDLTVPVHPDVDVARSRVSRKDRQQFAREWRSRSRSLEVATDSADFGYFYDRMHLPTMQARHGAAARSVSRQTAYGCIFRHGVLFFLTEGGERVAGALCRLEPGRRLVIRLIGVLDGAESSYRSATQMAIYLSILEWAAGQGIRWFDLSGCEPFVSKGIFQFKRKLHPTVALPDNHFATERLRLRVGRDSAGVRDFLVANPPLALRADGSIEAVYFHDEQRPARQDLRWQTDGITRCRLVDLDDFLTGLPTAADRVYATSEGGPSSESEY